MAGQEGFEPPTLGFGDRCSTVRATGLPKGFRMPQAALDLPLTCFRNGANRPHFVSRWSVWRLQYLQYFLNSRRSGVFCLFLVVE